MTLCKALSGAGSMRGGVELPNGEQAIIGDKLTMLNDQARAYVAAGVAEYAR